MGDCGRGRGNSGCFLLLFLWSDHRGEEGDDRRERERQKEMKTDGQTDRQTDRQTVRQSDRQTDSKLREKQSKLIIRNI